MPDAGPVLVLAPMQVELTAVVRAAGLRRVGRARDRYEGRVAGHDVVALRLGVGPEVARARIERELATSTPRSVLAVGIAGGVAPHTEIGDLVIPAEVLDLDGGARWTPSPLAGHEAEGLLATSGTLLDHEEILHRGPDDLLAIDMETAAVAEVCDGRGLHWNAIRAISDLTRDHQVGDDVLGLVREDGTTDVGAATRALLRRPGRAARFARLGRDSARATTRAAEALLVHLRAEP